MIIKRLIAQNWRNFQHIDVQLSERQFIVGPHASGKSNLLDIFRFLREIAAEAGGFQNAIGARGGTAQIRCLSAGHDTDIALELHLAPNAEAPATWRYALGFCQAPRAHCTPRLTHERVWKAEKLLLARPDAEDANTPDRLHQSALEPNNRNADVHELTLFLQSIAELRGASKLSRAPHLLQETAANGHPSVAMENGLLERIATADEETRRARLKTIEAGLILAVPQFAQLAFIRDAVTGHPHLQARYSHWPPQAEWQREDQFSDGTLRLIGLLWTLLESEAVLLIEEPELSLHISAISELAPLFFGMHTRAGGQVLASTQSDLLLMEPGIDSSEVLMLNPTKTGTEVKVATDVDVVRRLLDEGLTAGEVVFSNPQHEHPSGLGLLE